MSTDKQPDFKTREVHAGVTPDPVTGAILTPIYQSTTYVQESVDQYLEKGYSYSRSGNPTVVALEARITALEGGAGTACFATGMAATSATMMALLNAGEHAVLSDVVYGGTHRLSTRVLTRFGVEYSFVDTSDANNVEAAIRDNTKLIFTETPANPTLKLTDIAAVSEIAQAHGLPHVVDNTFLTPYYQRPLELGADISLHSTTKFKRRWVYHREKPGTPGRYRICAKLPWFQHVANGRFLYPAGLQNHEYAPRSTIGECAQDRAFSRNPPDGGTRDLPRPGLVSTKRTGRPSGQRPRFDALV